MSSLVVSRPSAALAECSLTSVFEWESGVSNMAGLLASHWCNRVLAPVLIICRKLVIQSCSRKNCSSASVQTNHFQIIGVATLISEIISDNTEVVCRHTSDVIRMTDVAMLTYLGKWNLISWTPLFSGKLFLRFERLLDGHQAQPEIHQSSGEESQNYEVTRFCKFKDPWLNQTNSHEPVLLHVLEKSSCETSNQSSFQMLKTDWNNGHYSKLIPTLAGFEPGLSHPSTTWATSPATLDEHFSCNS